MGLTYVLDHGELVRVATECFDLAGRAPPITIGREGAIRISDPWMSREHAALDRRLQSWVLRDLDSRNGSFVNGVRVGTQQLTDGDLIQLGHSLFCFRRHRAPRRTELLLLKEKVGAAAANDAPAVEPDTLKK